MNNDFYSKMVYCFATIQLFIKMAESKSIPAILFFSNHKAFTDKIVPFIWSLFLNR